MFRASIRLFVLALLAGCIDSYRPPAVANDIHLLVVDGFVDTGSGMAQVHLSRSNSPSFAGNNQPELNAVVSISDSGGGEYVLTETDSGGYASAAIPNGGQNKFQLHIRAENGEEFISDEVEPKKAPRLDSIAWHGVDDGVNVMLNTHDSTGNTKYYHWDFTETWEYLSPMTAYYIIDDRKIRTRTSSEHIERCWRTMPSTKIYVGTSAKFDDDVIRNYPLYSIPRESNKISIMYSVIVRQRAITEQEYEYYVQLAKTTESQGGLFDPLPTRVLGNLHHVGSTTPVLGYFSAGEAQQLRLFIDHEDLPERLRVSRDLMNCRQDTVCLNKRLQPLIICNLDTAALVGDEIITSPIYQGRNIIGYFTTSHACADCRTQGGTLSRPSFWPQ